MSEKIVQLNEEVIKGQLDELCDICRGKVMSKPYIAEHKGDYPVYSSQTENDGELGRIDSYDFNGEYLSWTTDGANAGTVFYRTGKFSVTNVCGLLKCKNDAVIPRYLSPTRECASLQSTTMWTAPTRWRMISLPS